MDKEYKLGYENEILIQIINTLMRNGKKSKIEKIMYEVLKIIKEKYKKNPIEIVEKAIYNIQPSIELKTIIKYGKPHLIPTMLSIKKQRSIAIRWLVHNILKKEKNKKNEKLIFKLYNEIINAYNKKGLTYKMKDDLHKLVEKNRANIYFRW